MFSLPADYISHREAAKFRIYFFSVRVVSEERLKLKSKKIVHVYKHLIAMTKTLSIWLLCSSFWRSNKLVTWVTLIHVSSRFALELHCEIYRHFRKRFQACIKWTEINKNEILCSTEIRGNRIASTQCWTLFHRSCDHQIESHCASLLLSPQLKLMLTEFISSTANQFRFLIEMSLNAVLDEYLWLLQAVSINRLVKGRTTN